VRAVRSGARGFVLKGVSDNDLLEAMRVVANGGAYLSPQMSDLLLTRTPKGESRIQAGSALYGLSPRELQVLGLMQTVRLTRRSPRCWILSEQTVRSYRKTMMKKLGVIWLKPQD